MRVEEGHGRGVGGDRTGCQPSPGRVRGIEHPCVFQGTGTAHLTTTTIKQQNLIIIIETLNQLINQSINKDTLCQGHKSDFRTVQQNDSVCYNGNPRLINQSINHDAKTLVKNEVKLCSLKAHWLN